MKRALATAAIVIAVVCGAGALFGPMLAQRYAEAQVDKALSRIRVQTTSVAGRGDVSLDLASQTVAVRDLYVESARREQRIQIKSLKIVGAQASEGLLTADRVVFDDVTIRSAGETITIPRIDIENYSGPERGLTATPGIGRNARTQADLIAMVSLERATAPLVTFSGDRSEIRRTLRNLSVNRVVKGAVESATVDGVSLDIPYLAPDSSPQTSSLSASAGPLVYEGVNLPTLWRFYAGDGAGDRQPFLKSGVIVNVSAVATLRPGGEIRASWRRLKVENVEVRPLAFPVTAIDVVISKLREGVPTTPAEIREQLLYGADGLRAVSFDRVRIDGAKVEIARDGELRRALDVGAAEIGPYADGRLDMVKLEAARFDREDGVRFAVEKAEAHGFEASGVLDYADKVGRDEVLMTTAPTAAELVRHAPRLTSAEASGVDAAGPDGEVTARSVRVEFNAPLNVVPQHVAFDLDDLDARPAAGSRGAAALENDAARKPARRAELCADAGSRRRDPRARRLRLPLRRPRRRESEGRARRLRPDAGGRERNGLRRQVFGDRGRDLQDQDHRRRRGRDTDPPRRRAGPYAGRTLSRADRPRRAGDDDAGVRPAGRELRRVGRALHPRPAHARGHRHAARERRAPARADPRL
ncbi:hypothetical protein [Chenggangzhangella methanolivorans]|uniref:Uncharacterized protein n=1 Tax=Chenggangzhangella methanolivorans TaxID=1437009 RepID=A0A9E6UND1_9HYPH|nr:hypothetical protein [Chenggangzhangella methanolivorans]QZO00064.1 hypothetical protein K6K41_26445 [Chenggangzhangella methanolivorans]